MHGDNNLATMLKTTRPVLTTSRCWTNRLARSALKRRRLNRRLCGRGRGRDRGRDFRGAAASGLSTGQPDHGGSNAPGESDVSRQRRIGDLYAKVRHAVLIEGLSLSTGQPGPAMGLRRAGKRKRIVIENGATIEVNEGLVELIQEAFVIRNQLLSGSDDSIEAMSGRLGMNKGRLASLIRLSYPNARKDTTMPNADCSALVARQRYVTGAMLFIKAMALYADWLAAGERRP
jgi:hypothetical protein